MLWNYLTILRVCELTISDIELLLGFYIASFERYSLAVVLSNWRCIQKSKSHLHTWITIYLIQILFLIRVRNILINLICLDFLLMIGLSHMVLIVGSRDWSFVSLCCLIILQCSLDPSRRQWCHNSVRSLIWVLWCCIILSCSNFTIYIFFTRIRTYWILF